VNFTGFGSALGLVSGGGLVAAVQETVANGPDLTGIAAIIAACAGMVSAVGALIIGLRSKKDSADDQRTEVLEDLVIKLLREKDMPPGDQP
jgi:hypothetical protein